MAKMKNPLFQKHYTRLVTEGVVKSILGGAAIGFFVNFAVALASWMLAFGGIWFAIGIGTLAGILSGVLLYFFRYRPNEREVARRIDRFGLEERVVTMLDLAEDGSYMASRQRENAEQALRAVEHRKLRIRFSKAVIALTAIALVLGVGMTTVVGLASEGKVPSGGELIDPDRFSDYIPVYYVAGEGGEIEGETEQLVLPGESTTPVVAIPDDGWMFLGWDDGYEYPERYDTDIEEECGFVAIFMEVEDEEDSEETEDGGSGEEEGDQASDTPQSSESSAEDGDEGGESSGGDSNEKQEGEEEGGTGSGDSQGMGAAGKWENSNQFIDGNTYYKDQLEMYYEMAMQIFAETGEIPPELREFFEAYFSGI